MLKPPVSERIVVFRYNVLREEVYREIHDALFSFLRKELEDEDFCKEVMNNPEVILPMPTFGDEEPDWQSLRVSVDRPSRFWNKNKSKCVQFFKDRLTVNLISTKENIGSTHQDLFAFFYQLLPFFTKHGPRLQIVSAGIDYQNVLNHEQLEGFTSDQGRTLELPRVLKAQMLGQEIDGTIFAAPLVNRFAYMPKNSDTSAFPARLSVSIYIPENNGTGWRMTVLLSATGTGKFPGFAKTSIEKFLTDMHSAVSKGYWSTFTEAVTGPKEAHQ